MIDYINIPLSIKNDETPAIERNAGSLEESIDNLLNLIVFTPKGRFAADPEFGFEYWNHEFSNINIMEFNNNYTSIYSDTPSTNDVSRKECEESLRASILTYEPRLIDPCVSIMLDNCTYHSNRKSQSKYQMRILITGYVDEGLGLHKPYEKKISFLVEPTLYNNII